MQIDVYATHRHFVDHLAPVWAALKPAERGAFIGVGAEALTRARMLGIRATSARRARRPTLVASYSDVDRCGAAQVIYLEHGAGQSYGGQPPSGSSPDLDERCPVVLFLCPNEQTAYRNRLHHPHAVSTVIGCPKLDGLPLERPHHDRPVVGLAFHWRSKLCPETMWAYPDYGMRLAAIARAPRRFELLGHGHPRAWPYLLREWRRLRIPHTPHADHVLAGVDALVVDNSSIGFEALAAGIPVVWLNARAWRRDVEHGMRFWEYADSGLTVDRPEDLDQAIADTIDYDPCAARRAEVARLVYGQLDGLAGARAAAAIRSVLSPV